MNKRDVRRLEKQQTKEKAMNETRESVQAENVDLAERIKTTISSLSEADADIGDHMFLNDLLTQLSDVLHGEGEFATATILGKARR